MQVNRVHRVSVSWLSQATVAGYRDLHTDFLAPAIPSCSFSGNHRLTVLLFPFPLNLARSSPSFVEIDKSVVDAAQVTDDAQQVTAAKDVALLTRKSIHFYPDRSMGEIDGLQKKG